MSTPSLRQPGSALLTVLLMMMAVGAIILLATKNSIGAARTVSQLDNAQAAREMARSAVDEGLLILQTDNGTPPKPQGATGVGSALYGAISGGGASLSKPTIVRRAFGADSTGACTVLGSPSSAAAEPVSEGCGSVAYDLSIRSYVKLTTENAGQFHLNNNEIPQQTAGNSESLKLHINSPSTTFTLSAPSLEPGQALKVQQFVGTTGGLPQDLHKNAPVSINAATTDIVIFKSAAIAVLPQAPIVNFTVGSGTVTIQRGSALIVGTGYAYGVQRQMLLSIPRFAPAKAQKTLVDFTGSFDANGLIQ